jgi:microcompartment protein CcmL/EutN
MKAVGLAETKGVNGDVGSVRAAVEVGAREAEQLGGLVGSHVIANPAEGVSSLS